MSDIRLSISIKEENSNMLRYGGVSFHNQSHGESFLALAMNRFEGNGLGGQCNFFGRYRNGVFTSLLSVKAHHLAFYAL